MTPTIPDAQPTNGSFPLPPSRTRPGPAQRKGWPRAPQIVATHWTQVPGPGGRYIPHALRTSFFAAFPIDHPRYVVFVLLDQPHGTKETGGFALAAYTAVPAAAKVISRIAPLLGVPNNAPQVALARGNS